MEESMGYPGSMSSSSETGDESSMTRKEVSDKYERCLFLLS